jgi:hypothetical protein
MKSKISLFAILIAGCGLQVHIPPAQTPVLVSNGLQVNGAGGPLTIGTLTSYCGENTAHDGPNGRGFYVTVKMPTLNTPEVTYSGIACDYWGPLTDSASQSLSQGPRPITTQQAHDLQGSYVGYFAQNDFLTNGEYHMVLGVLLGRGVPQRGVLEIRSKNTDPRNTGLAARSNPLSIAITGPLQVAANAPASVGENQSFTLSWQASSADTVDIDGPALHVTGLPASGSRQIATSCTGDRDQIPGTYTVTAHRSGCSTVATQSVPVTLTTTRVISQFEGLPIRPFEGAPFRLAWNAPGATSVVITGPNNFMRNDPRAQGDVAVTAPSIPANACALFLNFNYHLVATYPACSTRSRDALVSVFANVQEFQVVESGGPQCLASNVCLVQARNLAEARRCASCSIAQGCSWQ